MTRWSGSPTSWRRATATASKPAPLPGPTREKNYRDPSGGEADKKPEAPPADAPAEALAEAPVGLPEPKVTASAVSVVVPTMGEAVRYQRLLLPADAVHTVELWAREPLISRK